MSRGHNPLFLMMACTLPSAGNALGLGEIHVDSALNEPLAAEIDIVGATPEDLIGLTATVANRETFAHFNADRPSFLNTASFRVKADARGKPVLELRSTESFSEPLIDLVVDLRWRNGQLIRQYALLLDPAGVASAPPLTAAIPLPQNGDHPVLISAAPSDSPAAAINRPPADGNSRSIKQIKVGSKATLRGVAWRVGARSDADLNQMMIAIFRANPSAFNGNINRLRLGAVLSIPSSEEVQTISHADANRETHAQMDAWRESVKRQAVDPSNAAPNAKQAPSLDAAVVKAPVSVPSPPQAAPVTQPASPAEPSPDKAVLTTQLVSLEGSLKEVQAQLEEQHNKLLTMQAQQRYAQQHPVTVAAPVVDHGGRGLLAASLAGIAILAGACLGFLMRLRRRAEPSELPSIERVPVVAPVELAAPTPLVRQKKAERTREEPRIEVQEHHEVLPSPAGESHDPMESSLELSTADTSGINAAKLREELAAAKLREEIAAAWALPAAETYQREDVDAGSTLAQEIAKSLEETLELKPPSTEAEVTSLMPVPARQPMPIEAEPLDYDLFDLDQSPQSAPSNDGNELIESLKRAVEREPGRRDLRIKLLEAYHAAAATNRQGFLEAARLLAKDRSEMDDAEWTKIEKMRHTLGADGAGASSALDDDLANCA